MRAKAIVIDPADNVAMALVPLKAGELISVLIDGREENVRVLSDLPRGHKFELRAIAPFGSVLTYGEPIGMATTDIARGEHVHSVASPQKGEVSWGVEGYPKNGRGDVPQIVVGLVVTREGFPCATGCSPATPWT